MLNKKDLFHVIDTLDQEFPNPQPPLHHSNPFELLVAVILSAQCTDERVNKVTPNLFPQYNTPAKMVALGQAPLRDIIYTCGYHNQKSKNIIACAQELIERHDGQVPQTMNELSALPGVGRKTAGVVLAQAFNVPAFPVDTHILRIANRLGMIRAKTADKASEALKKRIPRERWIDLHLQIIFHGRKTCTARKPKCSECPVRDVCQWKEKENHL